MTKILVVDDETSILHSTALLLQDLGYETVTTTDHREVVNLLRKERPHVLLQDVRMPGLDLERLLSDIRADTNVAGTPVLLFSASLGLEEVQARVGAAGILEKPFKPQEVVEAIASAMASVRNASATLVAR